MLVVYVVVVAIFALLAGLCAFLITYAEYLKHYPDKRMPLKIAIQTALAAFSFFMLLALAAIGMISLIK